MNKELYGYHKIFNNDFKEVKKALNGKFITGGNYVSKFENALKKKLNCKFALTCSSGTSALLLAIKSLKLKKNSYILIPSINFLSSSNIAKQLGFKIIFVDIDPKNGLVTPEIFFDTIKSCKAKNIKPKLFIPQFHAGQSPDCKTIYKIAKKNKIFIIEDACHALGSKYNKLYSIGSCKFSDLSTFSFHPVKNITTGEGGLVTTNSKFKYDYMKKIRNHGMESQKQKIFPYKVTEYGYNFRLSDINCALGFSQLKKLNSIKVKKKKLYKYFEKKLFKIKKINLIEKSKFCDPCWHLLIVKIKFNNFQRKEKFMNYLEKNKIGSQIHYIPIYKHKIFSKEICFTKNGSEELFKQSITLPFHINLIKKDIDYIVKKINTFINKHS